MHDINNIEVGDRIRFKCLIAYRPYRARAIVRGIRADRSAVYVNANGCDNFVVLPHEITHVYKKGE